MAAGIFRKSWFPRRKPKIGLATLNANSALIGVSATTQFGVFEFDVTLTLSGVESTAQVGSLIANNSVLLVGVSSSTDVGTFAFQLDKNQNLSGVAATAQLASIGHAYSFDVSGEAAQTAEGSFVIGFSTVNLHPIGQQVTTAAGSFITQRPVNLRGLEVTTQINEDAFDINKHIDLTGLEVITSPVQGANFIPAGGGGGGAAGLFGDGEDGGDAFFGIGGYGGAADNFHVPRQNTPGANGNNGTEFNGVIGDGSGAGGGSYNPTGPGQNGGDGGNYGGGGGGGGAGRDPGGGLGGQGAFGIVYINYISSVTSLLVEIILDKDSASPFVFPSDWSGTNTIILVGPGGCGEDAGINGGNGGFGGDTVGVFDTLIFNPGDFVDFEVSSIPCLHKQTKFDAYSASAGANGSDAGSGGSGSGGGFPGGFEHHGGAGGPKGILSTLNLTPQPPLPTAVAFTQIGMLSSNVPSDRTFIIAGIPQVTIPAGIVMLPTSENLSIVTAGGNSYVVGSSQFYTIGELHWNGTTKVQGVDWQLVAPFKHIAQIINTAGIATPITAVYYRWDIGVRAGFKVNAFPVKFGFSGTTIIAEQVPPLNNFFTVEYTTDRRGDNPRTMFAIVPVLIDDLLPIHDIYDGSSGFQTYRPAGYKVYDQNDNQVWSWNGTVWIDNGGLAPNTEFYVKRLRQIMKWDGASVSMLYNAGDGTSSIDEVLEGPARPYPLYGESIGKNFLQDAFSANAAIDFPAAFEITQRPGDYDPWVPGI